MDGLYTNSSSRQDFLKGVFDARRGKPGRVQVAVAFLTDPEPLLELAQRGSVLKVIVRLGYPTSPMALRKLLNKDGLQVRYINNLTFHPKVYIFNGWGAVVGSANLTQAGMTANQEVGVFVEPEDPRYDELLALFWEYWADVRVLDESVITEYEAIYEKHRSARKGIEDMNKQIQALRPTRIDNVRRGKQTRDHRDAFLEDYKATYQGFLQAFRLVEKCYRGFSKRKVSDGLPLRIEVDSFLCWVRNEHATGDSYKSVQPLNPPELELKTKDLITQWFSADYPWLHEEVAQRRYPTIVKAFESEVAIDAASYDDILRALSCVNAFHDRLRFFPGGHNTHLEAFSSANSLEQVKKTLKYLVFGIDDYIERMARCIFDPEYKLNEFGRSAVQELLGWINGDDVPICNSRTLRSMRWIGYDVELVGG